jgi:hypothetical protein
MVKSDRDNTSQVFAITNFTEDLVMDCNGAADAELADVLATLIQELKRQGIISANIS